MNAPIERPILFSAPMVRALLKGNKTQTRRVIKPQPQDWETPGTCTTETPEGYQGPVDLSLWADQRDPVDGEPRFCPYGRPGDNLWVRENFTRVPTSAYRMSEGVQQTVNPHDPYEAAIYAADWCRSIPKWKPCIHMPRWASRIILEVVGIRAERLQDISEADAVAEGSPGDPFAETTAKEEYQDLWKSINGDDSWQANPWVWVVVFKRAVA